MRNRGPEKFRTLSLPRSVTHAEYMQQMEGAERMMLDMRRTLIEDYRRQGYVVTELGDSIHIEKPLK